MNGTALLFINGELKNPALIIPVLETTNFIVAVDGGLRHVLNLSLKPDLLLGDLDSVDTKSLEKLKDTNTIIKKYPKEKDETDLELAIQHVTDMGYQKITLIGALGGRVDQLLANIYLLTNPKWRFVDIKLFDGVEEVSLIRDFKEIKGLPGEIVSLIPVSEIVEGIRTEGLMYPLNDETLYRWSTRGISNVMNNHKANIWLKKGLLICVRQISTEFDQ
jgi:thiamine pyrophosphokinase